MHYLAFVSSEREAVALRAHLNQTLSTQDSLVTVIEGKHYRCVSPDLYSIRKNESRDYQALMESLSHTPDRIIYAWSWKTDTPECSEFKTQLSSDAESCFLLAKSLLTQSLSKQVVCIYVYRGNDSVDCVAHAAFGALAKSVAQESLKLIYKSLCIHGDYSDQFLECVPILWQELHNDLNDKQVRYLNGSRQRRVFKEKPIPTESSAPLAIREGGCYLITGGVSGLGLILAKHIASLCSVKLVLLGRREEDKRIEQQVETFREEGTECAYYTVDVSDEHALHAAVARAQRAFGDIHGVFHCAGIIRDARIVDKSLSDFKAVLAPKVFGALNLDRVTQSLPLDFILYFSSISAVLGNLGQIDYSYANGFMDHFAVYRNKLQKQGLRSGRSLSINWPLWEDGGMQVDEQIKDFSRKTLGLPPLATSAGLQMLTQVMHTEESQLLLLHGDKAKIDKLFGLSSSSDKTRAATQPALESGDSGQKSGSKNDHLEALQRDLIAGVVEILEVSPKDADIDTDMNQFGFDSLTITTFSTRIAEELNIELTPVVFFEYQTVRELSEYMLDEHEEQVGEWYRKVHGNVPLDADSQMAVTDESEWLKSEAQAIPVVPSEREAKASLGLVNNEPSALSTKAPSDVEAVETKKKTEPLQSNQDDFAIIGMDGILPQSKDLDEFWEHLSNGDDLISEIPKDRWSWESVWGDAFQSKNKTQVKWGGFIDGLEYFDAEFFGISRREAELMDPQHRIFLQTVWHCVENAGYRISDLAEENKVGLFCGSASIDYHDIMAANDIDVDVFAITGNMFSVLVNRISYLLNFRGPSEPVETACSSSMVAVHRAMQSIRAGECDVAIAGGVHLMMTPSVHIGLDKGGFLSQRGCCATFDESADGYVRGEGCIAILLKPLSKAQADGDYIHGVIRGSAVNHGGRVNTLTTPNPNAQTEVIFEAWKQAGVDPRTITCIEAHGTGTALGDPIEVKALRKAFDLLYDHYGSQATAEKHCALGSVKSNIGHLEFVAGISGMMKMIKAMQHQTLPSNVHFNALNPYIQLEKTPFYILDKHYPWQRLTDSYQQPIPLRAGISSFGFGGVNCHVALEEYRNPETTEVEEEQIILLSAKTPDALESIVNNLVTHLLNHPIHLADIAYTLATGRELHSERVLIKTKSLADLLKSLDSCLSAEPHADLFRSNYAPIKRSLDFLKNRQDVLDFQQQLLEAGQFDEMASYWVSGVDIEWQKTPYVSGNQRVPLPTYPFSKTVYWVGNKEVAITSIQEESPEFDAEIASLLQEGLIDQDQAQELQQELSLQITTTQEVYHEVRN